MFSEFGRIPCGENMSKESGNSLPGGSLFAQRAAGFDKDRHKNKRSKARLIDWRRLTNTELKSIVKQLLQRVEELENGASSNCQGGQ